MFKIGDKVKLNDKGVAMKYLHVKSNQTYEVIGFDSGGYVKLKDVYPTHWSTYDMDYFKLAEDDVMTFKTGDLVRLNDFGAKQGFGRVRADKNYRVSNVRVGDSIFIEEADVWYSIKYFMKVLDAPKFKVGDKVKLNSVGEKHDVRVVNSTDTYTVDGVKDDAVQLKGISMLLSDKYFDIATPDVIEVGDWVTVNGSILNYKVVYIHNVDPSRVFYSVAYLSDMPKSYQLGDIKLFSKGNKPMTTKFNVCPAKEPAVKFPCIRKGQMTDNLYYFKDADNRGYQIGSKDGTAHAALNQTVPWTGTVTVTQD